MPLYIYECLQKLKLPHIGKYMEHKEFSYAAFRNIKPHFGKQFEIFV